MVFICPTPTGPLQQIFELVPFSDKGTVARGIRVASWSSRDLLLGRPTCSQGCLTPTLVLFRIHSSYGGALRTPHSYQASCESPGFRRESTHCPAIRTGHRTSLSLHFPHGNISNALPSRANRLTVSNKTREKSFYTEIHLCRHHHHHHHLIL